VVVDHGFGFQFECCAEVFGAGRAVGIQADESDEILPDQHSGQGDGAVSTVVVATECGRDCVWVVAPDPRKDRGSGFIGMKELCIAGGVTVFDQHNRVKVNLKDGRWASMWGAGLTR
jgi:hypothetical protein